LKQARQPDSGGWVRIDDYPCRQAFRHFMIRLNPTLAVAFYNRGGAHYAKGELDPAIADYSEAIRLDPKLAVAFYNRGGAHYAKDDLVDRFHETNHIGGDGI
jgi:tetratricopeptide (TPR) repeat protein